MSLLLFLQRQSFLSFLFILVNFRTRSMQTQLYPQIIEPVIRIITARPIEKTYIVNLDC